ncbi:MAG: membrane protein insertase YidC [Alphaproteobacteria bacterium]|nr:membrane protein insertase YidC [Alphaproteobacteria bacterium]MCB9929478.1 membrane protein insertase YidC [Alphaproteobacteria bacterium]
MEQRNLFIAIGLAVLILIGSQTLMQEFFPAPPPPPGDSAQTAAGQTGSGMSATPGAPSAPNTGPQTPGSASAPAMPPAATRAGILEQSPRIAIDTPRLRGSIALRGGRIDDLVLKDYHVEVAKTSPNVVLFSPSGSPNGFYAQFGWVAGADGIAVPTDDTLWTASANTLTVETPVVLTWDNGQGLRFSRTIAIDKSYMFSVTDKVEASEGASATLYSYGLLGRDGMPHTSGFRILHEGPIGVFKESLKELNYGDLVDDGPFSTESTGGWLGFTDKYWLGALIPDQKAAYKARMLHSSVEGHGKFQADFLATGAVSVAAGQSVEVTNRLFAGAKEVNLLDSYEEALGIPLFDRAVDFGWFYFLTKPLFYVLDWLYGIVGNFGIAILIVTLGIKTLFFPLANKSYKAMSRMKLLQPKMTELKEKYGDDRQKMQQEMMAMYKREKINPAAGCIPILIQIPVFFSLYKVLFVSIEMRHAPFFGWIHDLSSPDPTNIFTLFGLIPWDAPHFLHFGAWPLIMGATMFLQQRLNPQPADPVQARMFQFMPLIFTIFLASFPAGLVIYWAWNNSLSIAQQWIIMRKDRKAANEKKASARIAPAKAKKAK